MHIDPFRDVDLDIYVSIYIYIYKYIVQLLFILNVDYS